MLDMAKFKIKRRKLLFQSVAVIMSGIGIYLLKLFSGSSEKNKDQISTSKIEDSKMILQKFPLGFQWPTQEPFLFCVHHLDNYPEGNGKMGIDSPKLIGRNIGSDFEEKDGFRMYHGDHVPGFPVHPHRGFETVTVVRKGYIDHSDSLGAAGRYGEGDTQWMTAGRGVQHSEMFPLLHTKRKNKVELFQIWLNLPRAKKMVEPHFTMFWNEKIPQIKLDSGKVNLTLVAGKFDGHKSLSPPPDSWASDEKSEVAIWLFKMKKDGQITLPLSSPDVHRTLYFFEGSSLEINNEVLRASTGAMLRADKPTVVKANYDDVEFLILQAMPIGEPVVQHGPFVMNTREEIFQTIQDYQRTQFGGWPWKQDDMVHGDVIERFAKYPNGKLERPT